jgi:hypothetical protein
MEMLAQLGNYHLCFKKQGIHGEIRPIIVICAIILTVTAHWHAAGRKRL